MSIKNFGIIAPGNYSSIKNISLKKVTSKSITPSAVPEMELESIRGIIHEPNPNIEDDEYIFVDSILNVEDEDYPFYEVNADKARIRINNISENVTSIYYVVDDNNANPHELTQNDIDSFNGFDIIGGNDTEFPFGEIKKITIYEYVNETEKVLEFYVKLIGAVNPPDFTKVLALNSPQDNPKYIKILPDENGYYIIPAYYKTLKVPINPNSTKNLNFYMIQSLIQSTAFSDSLNGIVNGQVIEFTINNEVYIYGQRYIDGEEVGEKLVPKNIINIESLTPIKQNPIKIENGYLATAHELNSSIEIPLYKSGEEPSDENAIIIRTYLTRDSGQYIRSDYSKEIKLLFTESVDDEKIPIFKSLKRYNTEYPNGIELLPIDVELNNKIYTGIYSYSDYYNTDIIKACFDNLYDNSMVIALIIDDGVNNPNGTIISSFNFESWEGDVAPYNNCIFDLSNNSDAQWYYYNRDSQSVQQYQINNESKILIVGAMNYSNNGDYTAITDLKKINFIYVNNSPLD